MKKLAWLLVACLLLQCAPVSVLAQTTETHARAEVSVMADVANTGITFAELKTTVMLNYVDLIDKVNVPEGMDASEVTSWGYEARTISGEYKQVYPAETGLFQDSQYGYYIEASRLSYSPEICVGNQLIVRPYVITAEGTTYGAERSIDVFFEEDMEISVSSVDVGVAASYINGRTNCPFSTVVYVWLTKEGETISRSSAAWSRTDDSGAFHAYVSVEEDTTYNYEIKARDEVDAPTLCSGTFTTPKNREITSADVPDATLLWLMRSGAGKTDVAQPLMLKDLDGIYGLNVNENGVFNAGLLPIKSLKGIELCQNMWKLDLSGQDIKDMSSVAQCKNLQEVTLYDNYLTTLPDLSEMTKLKKLDISKNDISESELAAAKLPAGLTTYRSTQRTETDKTKIKMADTYYAANNVYPFAAAFNRVRHRRTYTIKSAVIGGVDCSLDLTLDDKYISSNDSFKVYGNLRKYISDPSKAYPFRLVIADASGNELVLQKDYKVVDAGNTPETVVEKPEYLSSKQTTTEIMLDENAFMVGNDSVKATKVGLYSSKGTLMAEAAVDLNRQFNAVPYDDNRYEDWDIKNGVADLFTQLKVDAALHQLTVNSGMKLNVNKVLPKGTYNLVYTLTDGSKYTYRNAYEAVSEAMVFDISDSSYAHGNSGVTNNTSGFGNTVVTDQTDSYVSVFVYGLNVSKENVKPVFYNAKNEAITENVEAVETDAFGAFFRIGKKAGHDADWVLKKPVSGYQNGQYNNFYRVELEDLTQDKSVQDMRGSKTTSIWLRDVYYQTYDSRDGKYTVYFSDSQAKAGAKATITFYDYNGKQVGSAKTATITEDVNKLTGMPEKTAQFSITEAEKKANSGTFKVAFTNMAGQAVTYDSAKDTIYREGSNLYVHNLYFSDAYVKSYISADRKNIFYSPYWVGGVYEIDTAANVSSLTAAQITALSGGKFVCRSYEKGTAQKVNSQYTERSGASFWGKKTPAVKPKTYTVTFDKNGGKNLSSSKKTVTQDKTYGTLPTVTRSGYTFKGWYTAKSGGTKVTATTKVTIKANQTLYAQWLKNYTVTFNKNGGTKLSSATKKVTQSKTYGTLPTVAKKGYTFKGWYTAKSGGTKVTSATKVSLKKNQTLYAQWTKVKAPGKPKIPTLKNSKGKKMIISFKKVSGAKGYEIRYATNAKFKSSKKLYTTAAKKTISKLKKGKTYYVKVRAYKLDSLKGKCYGKYSGVRKLKIKK